MYYKYIKLYTLINVNYYSNQSLLKRMANVWGRFVSAIEFHGSYILRCSQSISRRLHLKWYAQTVILGWQITVFVCVSACVWMYSRLLLNYLIAVVYTGNRSPERTTARRWREGESERSYNGKKKPKYTKRKNVEKNLNRTATVVAVWLRDDGVCIVCAKRGVPKAFFAD